LISVLKKPYSNALYLQVCDDGAKEEAGNPRNKDKRVDKRKDKLL